MKQGHVAGLAVYQRSVMETDQACYYLARRIESGQQSTDSDRPHLLCIQGDARGFEGSCQGETLLCPLSKANAAALRLRLPWLRPQPLGMRKSIGCGDRLGSATPGHVRAVRNSNWAPVFAQQSMRENARTGRDPQQVMDDAMWGAFQEGWRQPWGSDADHLKTTADIDSCVEAGYTLYTIDPGDHVDNAAHTATPAELRAKLQDMPWDDLEATVRDMESRYLDRSIDLEGPSLSFDRDTLYRAAAKYGRAIAHTVRMYRHLSAHMTIHPFELEVSVDETETPTSPLEHLYVASELRRLSVQWVSLAPRYIGSFEKGVDYIGDLTQFESDFIIHAAIARALGPYKLSIHSGSDKFSIYPTIASYAGELVHLKTAGTSYLEALRAISVTDPELFRNVMTYALGRYEQDRATYHVSAEIGRVPQPSSLSTDGLRLLLNQFDARQILHVTFGSVLDHFGQSLKDSLAQHEEAHYSALQVHLSRHLAGFS